MARQTKQEQQAEQARIDALFTREAASVATVEQSREMNGVIRAKSAGIARDETDRRRQAAFAMAVYFRLAREAGEDVNVTHLAKDLAGVDESGKANPPIPRANIYKWRHMGNGIMEFGIEPDTDEWSALNEIANSVPMSWALDGYDFDSIRTDANGKPTIKEQFHGFSQENFDKALALYYPEGIRDEEKNVLRKPVSPKDAKDEIAKEYASEADKEQIEKDKREAIALRVKEAVKFLAANLKDVDADVWTAIEDNYRKANAAARQHSQRAAEAAHAAEVARVAAEGEAKAS